MKHIVKKRFQTKHIVALALAVSLVVFLILSIFLNKALGETDDDTTPKDPPEIIDGEAIQNGMALAYPEIETKAKITFINIKNTSDENKGEFGFYYDKEEACHILYYLDSNGNVVPYFPEIYFQDSNFNYSTLFATTSLNGLSVTLVDFLCAALQTPYFEERIAFEENADAQEKLLSEFGLVDGEYTAVSFTYLDADGKEVNRIIKIGSKSVTGTGYYFTVIDNGVERPYIYSSLSNYMGYALSSMNEFVRPLLVAEGLSTDKGQAPYLTTGYYQWLNRIHNGKCECTAECACGGKCESNDACTCGDGCTKTVITDDESRVVAFVDTISSAITNSGAAYDSTGYEAYEIDLGSYARLLKKYTSQDGFIPGYESRSYERIIKALLGKSLGDGGFAVSLLTPKSIIDFSDKSSVTYDYTIISVDAIITDGVDITEAGVAVDSHDLIKVTYTAKLGEKNLFSAPAQAVIDISCSGIDAATVAKIRAAKTGDSVDISFSVEYTKDNATKKSSKYIITEILDIYDSEDKQIKKVNETAKVGYRYEVWMDGVCVGSATYWLDLSAIEKGSEDAKIKSALLNKMVGTVNLEFDEHSAYYEYFLSFTSYDVKEISYFITSELVSAFKFQNSSERDPYYGESLYENLMEDEHKLYGLNSGVCETLVKILGGVSDETSTGTAAGLSGDEVVAIGLTPEVLEKYGLYAHTIYFELPRGILIKATNEEESDPEALDDYIFNAELGFTLYISEVDYETNTRYIASSLYDVVTRVPAEDFVFLKYDFETFWARRNLILMDVNHIDYLSIEFHTSDYKGNYKFDVRQNASQNEIGVSVTASGECTTNKFIEFINDPDYAKHVDINGGTSLKNLYKYESGIESTNLSYMDTLGASSFRDVMHMLYYVTYVNLMTDEERAEAPSEDELVFKMVLKVDPESAKKVSPYEYVYEFYRVDDRRVRVSLYQRDLNGKTQVSPVSDFYISTFAYKKITSGFISLLNAELIDMNVGYKD